MLIGINANLSLNETGYLVNSAHIYFILSGRNQSLDFSAQSTPSNPEVPKSFAGNIFEIALAIGRRAIDMTERPQAGETLYLQAFRILLTTEDTGRFVTTVKVFANLDDRELFIEMTPRGCMAPGAELFPPGTLGFNLISAMKCMAAAAISV